MGTVPRAVRLAWIAAGAVAVIVWNGVFDLLVTRGEQFYLWQQAEATIARAPRVSLDEIMTRTIHDAIVTASLWAALVLLVGAGAVTFVWRRLASPPRA